MADTLTQDRPGSSLPVQTTQEAPSDFLVRLARDEKVSAEKVSVLADVYIRTQEKQREWQRQDEAEQARVAHYTAKAAMQAELRVMGKDATNSHTHSKYTDFGDMWEENCPIWTRHGFTVSFQSELIENPSAVDRQQFPWLINLRLFLDGHGHREIYTAPYAPPDTAGLKGTTNKTVPQGNQSTITYLQRGLVSRALGIAFKDIDDDGTGGSRDSGYRGHTQRTGMREAVNRGETNRPAPPPPPEPPSSALSPWLTEVWTKLRAMLAADLGKWKTMMEQATQRARTLDDLAGLERLAHDDIMHPDTPPAYRNDLLGAFVIARKRFTAPKFEASLIDAEGREHDGEVFTDPVKYAEALSELYDDTFPNDREVLLKNNADGIDRAFHTGRQAQDILEAIGKDKPAQQTAPSQPEPPETAVPVPSERGRILWAKWAEAIREALTAPRSLQWLEAQRPSITEAPPAHRMAAIAAIQKAYPSPLPQWLAESIRAPQDSDAVWTAKALKDLDAIRELLTDDPAAALLEYNAWDFNDAVKTKLANLQRGRPELYQQLETVRETIRRALYGEEHA